LGLAVILLAYACLYGRTTSFDFTWDDPGNFSQSEVMRGRLRDVIRKGEHARSDPAFERMPKELVPRHESFRPVSTFSHWLDLRLFGQRPGPMHLHSVLLGALSVILVFVLAGRLSMGLWLPGLWALHPLHVEVFAYLSARSDLLAAIFSLLALLLTMRSTDVRLARSRWLWAVAASLAYMLSLFAKETNIALPFAVLALALMQNKARACLPSLVALSGAALGYFPLRSALMQATSLPMVQSASVGRSLLDCPGIVLAYAVSFVSPFSLTPDRAFKSEFVALGWAVAVAIPALLLLWRRLAPTSVMNLRIVALAMAALAPLLLPAALGVRSIGALSDRYACFPLLFLSIVAVASSRAIAARLNGRLIGPLSAGGVCVWAALLLVTAWVQVGFWRNEESLARYSATMEPNNSAALYRLATVATMHGDFVQALPLLEHAVALDDHNQRALNNLAVAYLNLHRVADAKLVLRKLAPLAQSTDKRFWYNVASVQLADGKLDKVCQALARALEIDPGYPMALVLRERACPSKTASRDPSAGPAANPAESPRPSD
jgi:tetratricopeptide (TPR) repeat protein